MNYVENVAAFIEWCLAHETGPGERLYNYCDVPAYDMNTLVLDVYRALGRPKRMLVHFPYPLAYLGGLCFDLLALVTRRKFAVSAIRVRKFTQETYFTSGRVPATGFVPPVPLEEGLRRTIDWEFARRVHVLQGVGMGRHSAKHRHSVSKAKSRCFHNAGTVS